MITEPMPIPDYKEGGTLPPGVHLCTLEEIKERFGRFRISDRRSRLYRQLVEYVALARTSGEVQALIIDGSFVTEKVEPGDIDLIVVLRRDLLSEPELLPRVYNVVSSRRVRKRFELDPTVVRDESEELWKQVDFFSQVRGQPGARKGLLRVDL
jgi:hypothetical protein